MFITRIFGSREERDTEYDRLRKLGTKHLVKRTNSVLENVTFADGEVKKVGQLKWLLSFPVQ
jgi:hypothetical protein